MSSHKEKETTKAKSKDKSKDKSKSKSKAKKAVKHEKPVVKKSSTPMLSVVIPVFNEELIIYGSVEQLVAKLNRLDYDYEIIITENGSTDSTVMLANQLVEKYDFIRLLHHPEPNYGAALRNGILNARGAYVVCDEIDLGDVNFYETALGLLKNDQADMVVGSKALAESQDERPLGRRVATRVLNGMLRYGVGFKGTDTHGLKTFNRKRLIKVVDECKLEKDLFASEFVIRAERQGFRVTEVPLKVREMRAPSINLYRRVPKALKDLTRLIYLVRVKG